MNNFFRISLHINVSEVMDLIFDDENTEQVLTSTEDELLDSLSFTFKLSPLLFPCNNSNCISYTPPPSGVCLRFFLKVITMHFSLFFLLIHQLFSWESTSKKSKPQLPLFFFF